MKRVERFEESRSVRLGNTDVSYSLRRSQRRRSVGLQVDERGLTVSVPWRCSEQRLQRVLLEAERWVLRQLSKWARPRPQPLLWRTGETISYLGGTLVLEVASGVARPRAVRLRDRLLLAVPNSADSHSVQRLALKWYRAEALELFRMHAARIAPLLEVAAPRVFLSSARTRWGSCNGDGSIRVSWRLVQAREALIEYVVAHELAHFHEMNHSARFWAHVARVCPDHRVRRDELNDIGPVLLLSPVP